LPQDRTDLNVMLKLSGPHLGCGRCVAFHQEDGPNEASRWLATAQKVRACPSAPMLPSKLSRCKGARDNALYNDEGCDRIRLEHAQSVAALACGRCCSAHDCCSWACTCAGHRHRRLRRLSDKI